MTITWTIDILSRAGTPGAYDLRSLHQYGGRPYSVGSLMWDGHCLMRREAPCGELPTTLEALDQSLPYGM